MEITVIEPTETVTLRDIDIVFGPGDSNQLTLEPDDTIEIPIPLASGDVKVYYAAKRENILINGAAVQGLSRRERTVTRKIKTPRGSA